MTSRSMSSRRSKKNRTKPFRLDRLVPGVGRIQRSSRTHDRRLFRQLNQMIDQMRDYGQHDILRAMRDGEWAPLEVYRLYRGSGGLSGLLLFIKNDMAQVLVIVYDHVRGEEVTDA